MNKEELRATLLPSDDYLNVTTVVEANWSAFQSRWRRDKNSGIQL